MKEKIENALNESRFLTLVAEVMLGFEYQVVFESGFHRLSFVPQYLRLVSLAFMLLALTFFISPATFHQIVEAGHVSEGLNRFITITSAWGLFFFAIALGFDFYSVCERIMAPALAVAASVLTVLIALLFWFGIESVMIYREEASKRDIPVVHTEATDLEDRIRFLLTEARVVLPGVQALLGFQFAAVFTDSFERLPALIKEVHLASLACVVFCTVLLMTPAAFHRIAERGRNTERMEKFSRSLLLAAMAFLAPGIAGDVMVVARQVMHSSHWAIFASGFTLLIFYGYWFGYMFYRKSKHRGS